MPAEGEARAGRRLAAIVGASEGFVVRLAVETHDNHPTARDVLRLLGANECEQVSVIWYALHTWLGGEPPTGTARLLGHRIAYLQIKDVASRDDLVPLPLGAGVLPLRECLELVLDLDPTGWVSWEYERAWHLDVPAVDEIGEAGQRWVRAALAQRATQ